MTSFSDCLVVDRRRLRALSRDRRRLYGARRDAADAEYEALLARSRAAVAARRENLPRPKFSDDLPVCARRFEIAEAILKNRVVVVCGETGSGKTTQLPKICLELGRGTTGLIGHTQPRRIAARATASRIARELESELGRLVGYKIRFSERVSPQSYVKLMTDGIALAEIHSDPYLLQYDTIIIDEAHERSLNVDFLLGYLKRLLPKRPDLRVIVTSATLDAKRFAAYFAFDGKEAPVIEVSGRMFPVELRYRPMLEEKNETETAGFRERTDLCDAVAEACDELARTGPGDILVFLPGEREIRETADALRGRMLGSVGGPVELLPLFARLPAAEQSRIFEPHTRRRIVLATNVAETSLTVPGIRYVVDSGLARIKRYSYRNKIEQLRVEKISRASANQRAGRCGRVEAGVCIRLYDEDDYAQRPEFTDPEILRSSLAGVILRMNALDLGSVESFPFVEAPPPKAVRDAYQLLRELGAVTDADVLTPTGRELARMPLDPRIARMIVAARAEGCVEEVLVVAAALSVQDVRDRPLEKAGAADAAHKKFADEKSEFLFWLRLWKWYGDEIESGKSRRRLEEACRANFLSPARMREWRDIHGQITALLAEQGAIAERGGDAHQAPARFDAIHRALLAGLLGNIGCKLEEASKSAPAKASYLGARGIRFMIHPGSTLDKKAGKWIVAAEIAETSRLFARCVARIEPEWIEEVGAHLVKKSYFDPHWEKKAMRAIVFERSTLYGLVVNPAKRVAYDPIDLKDARELFIRQGLVGGEITEDFARRWAFYTHNQRLILEIEMLEHKSRRPDVLVDDELIYAFYDNIIPADIANGADFDVWRRKAEREAPQCLFLAREDLMRHEAAGVTTEAFPHTLNSGGVDFALSYHFEPGSPKDGVTLTVSLSDLNRVPERRCEWLVPGLLKEKVTQLVKTLPQKIRSKLVPIPDFAVEFVEAHASSADDDSAPPLIPALIRFILQTRGLNARGWNITADAFRPEALPAHLFFNFRLVDEHGRQLQTQRNLADLRDEWGEEARQAFSIQHTPTVEHSGMTDWSFGALPESMELEPERARVYPALSDDGDSVSLHVFDTREEARAENAKGLARLFKLHFKEQIRYFEKNLPDATRLGAAFMALGTLSDLSGQITEVALCRACMAEPWPSDENAFRQRCAEAKPRVGLLMREVAQLVATVLGEWQAIRKKLPAFKAHVAAVRDIEKQLDRLFGKRFIVETPFERLQHFPRYLKAVALRLDKLKVDPSRDARRMAELAPLLADYERRAAARARRGEADPGVAQFRWLLEELRVHLFAQELKTPVPVSVKRLSDQVSGIR
ncbi:MAG: ATP-dependent RNA helicase HrpA [Candidatus Accumulibacter sp.]|jgi:ATP-dependent helicase HrpA|nr:ATP-dependent RNA helicase HrpA [Accumulibacter sp.]